MPKTAIIIKDMIQNPSILIVEDHKDFRKAVCDFIALNRVKARMVEAASGEEGVFIAGKTKPKVVIMDFNLRGMNGLEAAQRIRKVDPRCSIILLTMFDEKEISLSGRRRYVKAFIGKGDLYEKLIPALNKYLKN